MRVGSDGSLASGWELAFHPLYPGLGWLLHVLTRIPVGPALLAAAAAAGIAASIVVHLLAVEISGSREIGYLAAGLLGALPMSIVLQMAYAESLYLALAAGALLFACRARWWPAALCATAAGLTRPTGFVVAAVIPLAAWWLYRRPGRALPDGRPPRVRQIVLATAVGASGAVLFWAYVWARTGVWDAWFVVERRGWGSRFDGGAQTFRFLRTSLQHPDGLVGSVVCAIIVIYLLGLLAVMFALSLTSVVDVFHVVFFDDQNNG